MEYNLAFSGSASRDPGHQTFRLVAGVAVRKEKFGLLFYNYRGPRIYFVPSKDLIDDGFFTGTQTVDAMVDALQKALRLPRQRIFDHIESILKQLEAKGLVYGQPLC
jgi:putative mycofactocin binding protein MftB